MLGTAGYGPDCHFFLSWYLSRFSVVIVWETQTFFQFMKLFRCRWKSLYGYDRLINLQDWLRLRGFQAINCCLLEWFNTNCIFKGCCLDLLLAQFVAVALRQVWFACSLLLMLTDLLQQQQLSVQRISPWFQNMWRKLIQRCMKFWTRNVLDKSTLLHWSHLKISLPNQ